MTSFSTRFFPGSDRFGLPFVSSTAHSSSGSRKVLPLSCGPRGLALCGALLTASLGGPSWATETEGEAVAQADGVIRESVTPQQELLSRMEEIGSVRIVMHALQPADHLADQLSSLLAALGVAQVERRVVDEVPRSNQVRYYHSADREAGQVVGDALALVFDDVAVRDFGDYQPMPAEGLIEVWLR